MTWDRESCQLKIQDEGRGRRLIVASNREPYVHQKGVGDKVWVRPAGGLITTLDPLMQAVRGTWIAWGSGSLDRKFSDADGKVLVPPDNPSYTLKRLWLTPEEVEGHYYGYSNRALWPLCHILVERAQFKQSFWKYYHRVNEHFARSILEEIEAEGDEAIVWLQDYHLALCPKMIKEKSPSTFVSIFWHIPWPSHDVIRICPQRREIIEGLLGCDLIGFQTQTFAKNFLECARIELDAEVDFDDGSILVGGCRVKVRPFPISIDYDWFEREASSPKTTKLVKSLITRFGLKGKKIGLGVDRLDYTKGIPERLRALDLFFEKYPEYIGRFNFIQIAVPSRTHISDYRRLKREVERVVTAINEKYGREDWRPIKFIDEGVDQETLTAYYRMADLGIISSLHDGMNLIGKEYAACQVEEKGALLLSELAGVFSEMEGCIPINPFDTEGFADAIRAGLEMEPEERRARIQMMRAHVRENNIYKWMASIFTEIGKSLRPPSSP